jgi:hypothetical protein
LQERRDWALSVLQSLRNGEEAQDWIAHQATGDLVRLKRLISTLLAYEDFVPSKYDIRWLDRLKRAYCEEEPDWMHPAGLV